MSDVQTQQQTQEREEESAAESSREACRAAEASYRSRVFTGCFDTCSAKDHRLRSAGFHRGLYPHYPDLTAVLYK